LVRGVSRKDGERDDNMKEIKVFAIATAVMMLAVVGVAIVGAPEESDATAGPAGQMKVFVNSSGNWSSETVSAANGLLALKATSYYTSGSHIIDERYEYTYTYNNNEYTDINSAYGTITQLMGLSNDSTNTWNVLVYFGSFDEDLEVWVGNWVSGSAAIGYYKPFEDYASLMTNYGTANIALWYGPASSVNTYVSSLISYAGQSYQPLTPLNYSNGSVYEHLFYLKNATPYSLSFNNVVKTYDASTQTYSTGVTLDAVKLAAGITVVGYGSDAELALKQALGSDVSFYSSATPNPGYNSYGWMQGMFGVDTVQVSGQDTPSDYTDDHYYYWSTYTDYSTSSWAGYVVGAYSALTNAPLVDGSLAIVYVYS
jgi:hypothetical protein